MGSLENPEPADVGPSSGSRLRTEAGRRAGGRAASFLRPAPPNAGGSVPRRTARRGSRCLSWVRVADPDLCSHGPPGSQSVRLPAPGSGAEFVTHLKVARNLVLPNPRAQARGAGAMKPLEGRDEVRDTKGQSLKAAMPCTAPRVGPLTAESTRSERLAGGKSQPQDREEQKQPGFLAKFEPLRRRQENYQSRLC